MRSFTITILLAAAMAGGAAGQTPAKKPSPLEGTWIIDTINGQPTPPARGELALVVTGAAYEQRQNGQQVEHGEIIVTPTKTSLALSLKIGSGSAAGKTQLGYCQLSAPTLTCKLSAPGDTDAPADLTPEQGRFQFTAKKK